MVFVGNTFPASLVRRKVTITPVTIEDMISAMEDGYVSYWGHSNTLAVASEILGYDLKPATDRPAIVLDDEGFPTLFGHYSSDIYVLSPNYVSGYRPHGEEVGLDKIAGWQCLHVRFENDEIPF